MPKLVLLDTDIGSDIDDALALAYLLAQPACDLLGITTVSGEGNARASLASALCKAAGRAIPIYSGAEEPLLGPQRQPRADQARLLGQIPYGTAFPRGDAIEFLRTTIRANPGEVTLLAIGPMTNVALLFAVDPEVPRLLKQLILMIGSYAWTGHRDLSGEWNAYCDPQAAAMVFRAPVAVHRSVPLDVSMKVQLPIAEARVRFNGGPLDVVRQLAAVELAGDRPITFHDPLAAASLFDDSICGFDRGTVEVDLVPGETFAGTRFIAGPAGQHEVALRVDPARFFQHYFAVTGAQTG